jgi:pimeloyl-ACP methyl ester carboxylesterase
MKPRSPSLLVLVTICAALGWSPAHAGGVVPCDGSTQSSLQQIADLSGLPPAIAGVTGEWASPSSPSAMVVFMHGYGQSSVAWENHILQAVSHGALAFATNYRGTTAPGDGGAWHVREGAEEAVAMAKYFRAACPTIEHVYLFGVSMGGNSSGLAAASADATWGGGPLFDQWIDVEGVTDLAEEYVEASAVALSGNPLAVNATKDIESECGGTLAEQPACYAALTVVLHTSEIAATGIHGVTVVHGVDDGEVGTDQGREISTALRASGVATDQFTVLERNAGDPASEGGTTLSGNVGNPLFGAVHQTYPQPLAGHGWEGSDTQAVIATGFTRLWALISGSPSATPANHEFVVNGSYSGVPFTQQVL